MKDYQATVVNCTKELTAKERIALKDTSNATKLDSVVNVGEKFNIDVDYVATIEVHNSLAENQDYTIFVVVDKSGEKYITGSQSFITSYYNIESEMENESEPWTIDVYKVESKNYKGRYFLTCSIA